MSELEVFQFPATGLPGKTKHGGYAYVIEFDTGLVKVGMTQNPQSRIPGYVSQAAVFGVQPMCGWLSPMHAHPARTEDALIAIAIEMGGVPTGREYFRGVGFREVAERAASLAYSSVDIEAAEKRSREFHDAFVRNFSGKRSPEALIAEVFDRQGDTYHLPELGAEAIARDLVRLVAEALGTSVASVREMDYVDIVEATTVARVRSEALRLRAFATATGRTDLLRPLREARQLQMVFPSEAA